MHCNLSPSLPSKGPTSLAVSGGLIRADNSLVDAENLSEHRGASVGAMLGQRHCGEVSKWIDRCVGVGLLIGAHWLLPPVWFLCKQGPLSPVHRRFRRHLASENRGFARLVAHWWLTAKFRLTSAYVESKAKSMVCRNSSAGRAPHS